MEICQLNQKYYEKFIAFCKKHREHLDESYLSDEDLNSFTLKDTITYIALKNEEMIGVASLMTSSYFLKGRKSRFRIFYSLDESVYEILLQKVIADIKEVDQVFLFINEADHIMREIFHQLGFQIERYSFLLSRDTAPLQKEFKKGYHLVPFQFHKDEGKWCQVINQSFKVLKGHISDITEDMVLELEKQDGYMPGGMMLLKHQDETIGVLSITLDYDEGENVAYIGPIAVIPSYQHQGLGTALLQAALGFAYENNLKKAILTVNAENEKAVHLYLKEGFKKIHAVISYCYNIKEVK